VKQVAAKWSVLSRKGSKPKDSLLFRGLIRLQSLLYHQLYIPIAEARMPMIRLLSEVRDTVDGPLCHPLAHNKCQGLETPWQHAGGNQEVLIRSYQGVIFGKNTSNNFYIQIQELFNQETEFIICSISFVSLTN
jgi:hypothetical protein